MRAPLFLLAVLISLSAHAEPSGLIRDGAARVVGIVDGDTVMLDSGVEVRLVGLQAPKLALGRRGFVEWPLADRSRDALADLVLDRRVTLAYGGRRVDRHGRALAHLINEDGLWVQGEMLRLGMARVYSFADNRTAVAEMLAAEGEARAAGAGIWNHPFYAVRTVEEADRLHDSFQLVEGVVIDAAKVRGRVYLNFGTNWRDDFTVSIAPSDVRAFGEAGQDPLGLTGRRVRVRGWIYERNGPMIDATHPEQIELIEDVE
ncbi:MAG: thermonuclease family protein [Inquilinus sp.]|nr:thermonuclease family protein [Inquilinus sp.]